MWPPLVSLGPVNITFFGLSLVVAFILGSFLLWRELKDDYEEEKLLTLWLWLVVAAWLGSGVWVWWSDSLRQIWGTLLVPLVVLVYWCRQQHWDVWRVLDVWGPVTLAVLVLGLLGWGPDLWLVTLAAASGVVIAAVVKKHYRRWRWYVSGRSGLVGTVSVFWWSVVNLVVANVQPWAVYSQALMLVAAGVVVYWRSGRKISRLWPRKV